MGNVNLQRVVLDTLANYISTSIAALSGKVSAVRAGPETRASCLALKLIPKAFTFDPEQEDEVYSSDVDDGKVVVDVGLFTGLVTLELYTNSPAERELLEQQILDLFMSSQWSPGTLQLTTPALLVNGYMSLYESEFKVSLQDSQWNDEMAFESKRYSFLDITIDYNALTTFDANTISSLQVALSTTDASVESLADIDSDALVEIEIDGTIERVSH